MVERESRCCCRVLGLEQQHELPPSPLPSPWTFSMELLPHRHTLRLFLLPPLPPAADVDATRLQDVAATLLPAPPRLSCSWHHPPPHRCCSIRLRLPLLLFDYSSPPRSRLHRDCIEISIHLLPFDVSLLPILDSQAGNGRVRVTEDLKTNDIDSVVKGNAVSSQSHGRLREQPISTSKKMNGNDLCCSSMGETHLFDATTVRTCNDHGPFEQNTAVACSRQSQSPISVLVEEEYQGPENQLTHETADIFCINCSTKVSRNPIREFIRMPYVDWRDVVENWFGACCCSFGSKAESLSKRFEKSLNLRPGRCLLGLSTCYISFSDAIVDAEHMTNGMNANTCKHLGPAFPAVGDGFMVSENEYSRLSKWKPVYCISCRSLIGGYVCKMASSECVVLEGLHIFRFQIKVDGVSRGIFRYAPLGSLFAKSLQLKAEEDTSYKFLIRSLTCEVPLLQLMIVSCDSLISAGSVSPSAYETARTCDQHSCSAEDWYEDSKCMFDHLHPVMKVMFSDCSEFSSDKTRSIETWAKQQDAEIVYMFDELVQWLTKELLKNSFFFPASCRISDEFKCSFLCTDVYDQSS